jgi:hypothetical protein
MFTVNVAALTPGKRMLLARAFVNLAGRAGSLSEVGFLRSVAKILRAVGGAEATEIAVDPNGLADNAMVRWAADCRELAVLTGRDPVLAAFLGDLGGGLAAAYSARITATDEAVKWHERAFDDPIGDAARFGGDLDRRRPSQAATAVDLPLRPFPSA